MIQAKLYLQTTLREATCASIRQASYIFDLVAANNSQQDQEDLSDSDQTSFEDVFSRLASRLT